MDIMGSPSLQPEWKEATMTTLVLKNGLAKKALSSAEFVLGEHPMKSGRYWYKGYQNCDLIILKKDKETHIQTSGGVRFNMVVQELSNGEAKGRVTLLGWLKESPNALRIVMSILEDYGKNVVRRRQKRLELEEKARAEGLDGPQFREPLGTHFSIKIDESKLEDTDKIDEEESNRNFETAVKTHWYHQNFVSFCKKLGVKCYYRSVQLLPDSHLVEV
jgi:hypothetical protein